MPNTRSSVTLPLYPIGTSVRKYFAGHGIFAGTVESFDVIEGLYTIRYEDDDAEELDANELAAHVVVATTAPTADNLPSMPTALATEEEEGANNNEKSGRPIMATPRRRRSSSVRSSAIVTPGPQSAQKRERAQLRTPTVKAERQREKEKQEDDGIDEEEWKQEEGMVSEDDEGDGFSPSPPLGPKLTKKRRSSGNSTSSKPATALKKSSPKKRSRRTSPHSSKKQQQRRRAAPQASVADQGLPVGARAVGRNGYELRSLDGVLPLLTRARLDQAEQQLRSEQAGAAAQTLLCPDIGTVRDFVRVLRSRWGLDDDHNENPLPVLSDRSQARLEQGTASATDNLPGRLLVVRVADKKNAALEGRVFSSAAALHEEMLLMDSDDHTTEHWATYAMQAVPDATFGPWRVVQERLEGAGVEPGTRLFRVEAHWSPEDQLVGSWCSYEVNWTETPKGADNLHWSLLEGGTRDGPIVVLGASSSLVNSAPRLEWKSSGDGDWDPYTNTLTHISVIPPIADADVRLQSSQLEKAMRRSFCSPAPLLEACRSLVADGRTAPVPPGGTLQLLVTIWKAMLRDASPFGAPDDQSVLGLEELLLLSLVAKADRSWKLPPILLRKVIATALRTQHQPRNSWNLHKSVSLAEKWELRDGPERSDRLHNVLVITQAATGLVTGHSASLRIDGQPLIEPTHPLQKHESDLVDLFEGSDDLRPTETRLQHLDEECRLAAYDPLVSPSTLLLVQTLLPHQPRSWKQHSLPALSHHVRELTTNINPRRQETNRLARVAAWGGNTDAVPADVMGSTVPDTKEKRRFIKSAREVATKTGVMSKKEHQIVDCFEAIQKWRQEEHILVSTNRAKRDPEEGPGCRFIRTRIGPDPTAHDGRIAFLLCFARAEEIQVHPKNTPPEVLNVLFCGNVAEPLLVQRIGKARQSNAVVQAGPGSSGAMAVPSLGYVSRSGSETDKRLFEAAERGIAERWKGGRIINLPIPPAGFQWNLPDVASGSEEEAEKSVQTKAWLGDDGGWKFAVAGVMIDAFDARKLISPCLLDSRNHKPLPLGLREENLLRSVLYAAPFDGPRNLLKCLHDLHLLAETARSNANGANEGHVYAWLPIAAKAQLTSTVWRDAILALKTRESDSITLGPVGTDGTCKRDMTEGCLVRIFHVLEFLYPATLLKKSPLKWLVRPRGAGYHHMMSCLDQLSRDDVSVSFSETPCVASAAVIAKQEDKEHEGSSGVVDKSASKENHEQRKLRRSSRRRKNSNFGGGGEDQESVEEESYVPPAMESDTENSDEDLELHLKGDDDSQFVEKDFLPVPTVLTKLWPHQEASVDKIVSGVKEGRRGHADASAVGAGKTLTALATMVKLAEYMARTNRTRNGMLVMLPTKALVKEWLIQIAIHVSGWHVVEQREDGQLHSLTYGKSTPPPPIDGNTVVISTLDRVRAHPFIRQTAWDFVVIDECLAVQNAAAKRCPSAWRQIEVSALGVLMLSATFFRSKFSDLFYMIRMLRGPFPRTLEWLPATIHEHIVCQVPETDRSWTMRGFPAQLPAKELAAYRGIIETYKRNRLNNLLQDHRKLFVDLESFLREKYEGRRDNKTYAQSSVMADAFHEGCKVLLGDGHRPLVFADTALEASHILSVLRHRGMNACLWSEIARRGNVSSNAQTSVIVATKSVEGQGINMQSHADAIVCRPTPGDHLEQMKGRVDRPGQTSKHLKLLVVMAEHTIEEAKFANIQLAGNFFRQYIAPVATKYRESIDLEATLAAGGSGKLKHGTVAGVWRKSLEAAGGSGTFAIVEDNNSYSEEQATDNTERKPAAKRKRSSKPSVASTKVVISSDVQFAPRNKVLCNKSDPVAVRQAKRAAQRGEASNAIRQWLFPAKKPNTNTGLVLNSLQRFSDVKPPVLLEPETIRTALQHLSGDPKLAAIIERVGEEGLLRTCGDYHPPTQASLFDHCVRAISFIMVSQAAGNSFVRRLGIKIGVCIEHMPDGQREPFLEQVLQEVQEGGRHADLTTSKLLDRLLAGSTGDVLITVSMVDALVKTCLVVNQKQSGYPHLCGPTFPCGKNDNWGLYLQKARDQVADPTGTTAEHVSAGFSQGKAGFLIALVRDFSNGTISATKISQASDREAAKMLLELKGIGDWCAGQVLVQFLRRADVMWYGDLTVRNYLNDLYDVNHKEDMGATELQSAADFPDNRVNRNLLDQLALKNGWYPYRSVVCLLMYHLEEEGLTLL